MGDRADHGGADDLHSTHPLPASPDHAPARAPSAAASRRAGRALWGPFAALASAILVVDQLTKAWIVANVRPGEALAVVGDVIRLVHTRNTGALFGLFRDGAPLFAVASVVVIAAIVWYHGRAGRSPYLTLTLGLLLGGALGNLVDRFRHGYVVDFVDAGIGALRWYTFNVADAAISAALLLLVLLAVRPSLAARPAPAPAPPGVDPRSEAPGHHAPAPPVPADREPRPAGPVDGEPGDRGR